MAISESTLISTEDSHKLKHTLSQLDISYVVEYIREVWQFSSTWQLVLLQVTNIPFLPEEC